MMRRTGLKEMFIVRYADDFRIFCRNREDAERTMASVTQWITERLHLEVSPEKTRIVNVRKRYSEFLGFKIRVFRKGEKYVVRSHICDKKLQLEERKLVEQAKHIANPQRENPSPLKSDYLMKWYWVSRITTKSQLASVWIAESCTAV